MLNNTRKITLLSDRLNDTGSQEGGMEAITYLIEKFTHLDDSFVIDNPMAPGSLRVLKQVVPSFR